MNVSAMCEIQEKLTSSILQLEKWIEHHEYKGYEPFDGLLSYLRPYTFGNLLAERLLLQLVRQSPVNFRPLLGVKPQESTKGRGYVAWGYLTMLRLTGDLAYRDKAVECLDWLMCNKSSKFENYSWANHFDFAGRDGRYAKNEPIIVWTSLIGQAFLEAYEVLKDDKYLEVAKSICEWILALPRERTDSGTCISYHAVKQSSIHNSNMLGAAMLARTAKFTGNSEALNVARDAIRYSCTRQLADGGWYYAEGANQRWIDNFHTGYNLDSLKCYIENSGDRDYDNNLHQGFRFFISNFFEKNGRPKYYHTRTYPVDSQCAAQAIETLVTFSDHYKDALPMAVKVAQWMIDHMMDKDGHFYYRQYPMGIKAKTPMLHWAQATTYRALTLLLSKLIVSTGAASGFLKRN